MKMNLRKTVKFLSTLWLTVIVGISISVFFEHYAPSLEGRYFPVVGKARISRLEIVAPRLTRIWLDTTKLRDCSPDDIEWWYGNMPPGISARIPVALEEFPRSRPVGEVTVGPWLVALPADLLVNSSFAYVTHSCHVLWNTRSLFFTGDKIVN